MKVFRKKRLGWQTQLLKGKKHGEVRPYKKEKNMNNWEHSYATMLSALQAEGKVKWFAFNSQKFLIGEGAWYKPDFIVVLADGTWEAHEIKGYEREAAIVRFKSAAMLNPQMTWRMFTRNKNAWYETRTIEKSL